jgi:sugar phosphate isomerase/epimerase
MRLGATIYTKYADPDQWVAVLKERGYRAAYAPVGLDASALEAEAYRRAAEREHIVIAEVGAWSNPMSSDPATRAEALAKCKKALDLADRLGARCCVNIAGSRGAKWDGPDPRDLTGETFDMIVAMVREIIDEVKPKRTWYTLETMPWMYPDSTDSYLKLMKAIDRRAFAVHFDPVNMVSSPQLYFRSGDLIRDFVARLGPHIKSCHVKDIILRDQLTTHLDEVRPGLGKLDYPALFASLGTLDADLPVMIEHLPNAEEVDLAAAYLRKAASAAGAAV